jgi:hypothetical protein
MNMNTLRRRIGRIELERSPPPHRQMVVYKRDGESDEEAVARAGVWWPVFVVPEPCATTGTA